MRSLVPPILALLLLVPLARGQALQEGVTVYIYDVQGPLDGIPAIINGQTPNVSQDEPVVDFAGGWAAPPGSGDPFIEDSYVGLVWGWLVIPETGSYEFRLSGDDGSKLYFNRERNYHPETNPNGGSPGSLVVDNDQPGPSSATGTIHPLAGTYPFTIEFYQQALGSSLTLEWRRPGESAFSTVPPENLRTELDQTHVSSPGLKSWYYPDSGGGAVGGPGDGRPLDAVHPGFTLEDVRPRGFDPPIGGIDFLPDGRMVICTWEPEGAVYLLDHYEDGDPATTTATRFAEGLGEPLGLLVHEGGIYVTQKRELTRLVDSDGDDWCDEYEAIADGWPMSFNYHEFSFNLVEKDGCFWFTTSVPLRSGSTAYSPQTVPADGRAHFPVGDGPGSLWKYDLGSGELSRVASGLRTPNGLGIGPGGGLFCSDNQGDWLPSSRIYHLREGEFYGHQEVSGGNVPYARPALWLEHGRISNSPTQPVLVPGGTYGGQLLFGDVTHGGVKRASLEEINGVWQGAAFRFSQGLEVGVNRVAWGPDGALYVGGLGSGGNWNHNNKRYGLQRLSPNGQTTFEMHSIRSRADGFEIEFTEPVPVGILSDPENYEVRSWRNIPSQGYGAGRRQNEIGHEVAEVEVSSDRRTVHLALADLEADREVYFRLSGFVNDDGVAPWSTEAWYTLNEISGEGGPSFVPAPPAPGGGGRQRYEAEDAELFGADLRTTQPGFSGSGYAGFGGTLVLEAEDADYSPSIALSTEHEGFTGTGFLDFPGQDNADFIEWTVNLAQAGSHALRVRYAFGSTDRPLELRVNDVVVDPSLDFPGTGAWSVWSELELPVLALNAGDNRVRLTTTGNAGANYDSLIVPLDEAGAGSVRWTVEVPAAGEYDIAVGYASGSGDDRALDLSINGSAAGSLVFADTGGWGNWAEVPLVATLEEGANEIELSTSADGPVNLDFLEVRVGVSGPPPPPGALVLFDGGGTAEWEHIDGSVPIEWPIADDGSLKAPRSSTDIRTRRKFRDYQLHVEWRSPSGGSGQRAGNSGVSLHESYELQILNTPPSLSIDGYPDDQAAAIDSFKAPDRNASLGAGLWQSFDLWFTAPRWSGDTKISDARVTAYWNGELVHHDVAVSDPTPAGDAESPGPQAIRLQAHDHDGVEEVAFRNVWLLPDSEGLSDYQTWAAWHGLFGADADPDADTDRDGIRQFWEFLSNGDPNVAASRSAGTSLLPELASAEDGGLELRFLRRIAAEGIRLNLEHSPDLHSWSEHAHVVVASEETGDGVTEWVTIRFDPPAGDSSGFFRMSGGFEDP